MAAGPGQGGKSAANPMRAWERGVAATLAGAALVTGGVAVFVTDNGSGSAALVAAGIALGAIALFGDRIASIGVAGTQVSLVEAVTQLEVAADEAEAAGDPVAADRIREQAAQLLELAHPAAERYEQLRLRPSGRERTAKETAFVNQARSVARSGQWDADSVRHLFQSGRDGMRLFALGLMEGDPRLTDLESVIDAIDASRSAFEQYHALLVAQKATRSALDPQTAGALRDALQRAVESPCTGEDRRLLARETLLKLDSTGNMARQCWPDSRTLGRLRSSCDGARRARSAGLAASTATCAISTSASCV